MLLQKYIKRMIAEAILNETQINAAYKQKIKSLFEQFINKFSASYIDYRKQNYPNAWTVKSIFYAEDFEHQHIKLLYKKRDYKDYTLIFEHEGSIYTKALSCGALVALDIDYWHEHNYLFKLSVSDFEAALDVADNYGEFIVLCEQMNKEYKKEE